MKQNLIDDILNEMMLTDQQKKGFVDFLKYAKNCQETGTTEMVKAYLKEKISETARK